MMRCVTSIGYYGANGEMLEVTISLIDTGPERLEKTRRIERGLFASALSQSQIIGNRSFVILSIICAEKQSSPCKIQNRPDQLLPSLITIWRQAEKSRSWSENKTQTASCRSLVSLFPSHSLGHGWWWHWWHSTLSDVSPGVTWGWSVVTGHGSDADCPLSWPELTQAVSAAQTSPHQNLL